MQNNSKRIRNGFRIKKIVPWYYLRKFVEFNKIKNGVEPLLKVKSQLIKLNLRGNEISKDCMKILNDENKDNKINLIIE